MRALSGSRFFADVALRAMVFDLKQVHAYLTNPILRAQALARVAARSVRTRLASSSRRSGKVSPPSAADGNDFDLRVHRAQPPDCLQQRDLSKREK